MARHDTRDSDTGQFTERDPFDMSSRIPKTGRAATGEFGKYASLNFDLGDGKAERVASAANGVGDNLDHPPAGDAGSGADYIRDRSNTVDRQNADKARSTRSDSAYIENWKQGGRTT